MTSSSGSPIHLPEWKEVERVAWGLQKAAGGLDEDSGVHAPTARNSAALPVRTDWNYEQSQPFPPYTPPLRCNPLGPGKVSSTVPLTLHPLSPWLLLSLSSPSLKPVSLAERQAPFPVFLSASPAHSSAAHTGSEPGRQGMRRGNRSEKAPARSQTSTRSSISEPTRQPHSTAHHHGLSWQMPPDVPLAHMFPRHSWGFRTSQVESSAGPDGGHRAIRTWKMSSERPSALVCVVLWC